MTSLRRFLFLFLFLSLFSVPSFGAPALKDIKGVSSTNITTLCAVGDSGTILKSNDYGASWTSVSSSPITTDNPNLISTCFAGGDLWVAGSIINKAKAYLSSDGGQSWTDTVHDSLIGTPLTSIFFDPTNPSNGIINLFVAIDQGRTVYTTNKGGSWTVADFNDVSWGFIHYSAPFNAVAFSRISGTFWAVGDHANIGKSTDSGQTWIKITSVGSDVYKDINFVDSNYGFIGGSSGAFLYTTNSGSSWTKTNPISETINGVSFINSTTGWICTSTGKVFKLSIDYGTGTVTPSAALNMTQVYPTRSLTPVNPAPAALNRIFALDENNIFTVCNNGSIYAVASSNPFSVASVTREAASARPNEAPVGFTGNLIIAGTNFQIGSWANDRVSFGASDVTINSITRNSSSQLTVNVSIGSTATPGNRTVTVTNIDGSTATGNFTINPLPTISSITPPFGTQGTSVPLTVAGTGFQTGITANFGSNISNTITDQTPVQLKINLNIDSSAATGTRTVTFTNPDTGSTTETFTVSSATVPNPTISSVSPSNVVQGTTNQDLIVTGTNFEAGAKATFTGSGITVNSTTVNSSTQLTVNISVTSNAATGQRTITVTNLSGGSGSANDLFYITTSGVVNPSISSVTPTQVFRGTPQIIIINGTGFKTGASVSFNPPDNIIINSNTFKDPSQIEVMLTVDLTAALGKRGVTVTNYPDGGHGSLADAIDIVVEKPPPTITDAICYPNPYNPNAGPATLQFFLTQNALVEISLIDISGTQKMSFTTNATVGYNKIRWDGKDYSGGNIGNGGLIGLIKADGKLQNKKFKIIVQNR